MNPWDDPKLAAALQQFQHATLRLQASQKLASMIDRCDYCGVVKLASHVVVSAPAEADPDEMLPFVLNLAWALAVSHEARQICPPDSVVPLLEEAIAYLADNCEGPRLASALNNYASVRRRCRLGDLSAHMSAAIAAYDKAMGLYAKAGSQYVSELAKVQLNRAAATADQLQGDPTDNLEVALSLTRDAKACYNAAGNELGAARAWSYEGALLPRRFLGSPAVNWDLANTCHQEALRIWQRHDQSR